ncbi:LANO_0F09582g1_1 [Lachancea nothofagi CBS 11611]|uniref:LANO_0F09582g1_1 n=1 Tax=Lachancea nothofagi CBS 11611 TaxID=1266666 RepID=A0A1G4K9Y7_9SACH|nr:LANO_0F09582g1_1 [Lachancea nothofagi CBS 11611]
MEACVSRLMSMGPPGAFWDEIVKFLASKNVISSTKILANLHSTVYVALGYHLVFLVSKWFIFPPLVRWRLSHSKDHSRRGHMGLVNQAALHFVSLVQSFVILYLCLTYLNTHGHGTTHPNAQMRVFHHEMDTDVICVFAIGYFVWDAMISMAYSTAPFVLHGVVSALMFSIGLKPYIQFYAPAFLMFELSNPFLNFRWFGIKFFPQVSDANKSLVARLLNLVQLLNNVVLIMVFFGARIAWGWYQIFNLCCDFWHIRHDPRFLPLETFTIVSGNFILDVLNLVWFCRMLCVAKDILTKSKRVQDKPATEVH